MGELNTQTMDELKESLKDRGLQTSGIKVDLVKRLYANMVIGKPDAAQVPERKRARRKKIQEWMWMLSMATSFLLCGMGNSCIAPFYPKVAVYKGMSSSLMSFIMCVVYVPQLFMIFFNAKLMLTCGPTNIYKLGTLSYGISNIAFGYTYLIDNLTWFAIVGIGLKLVQGVGYSMILNSSSFIATQEMPQRVSFAIGLFETGNGLGYALGPSAGGCFYDLMGFPMPLLVTGIPQLILFALSFLTMKGISNPSSKESNAANQGNGRKLRMVLPAFIIQLFINGMYTVLLCNYDVLMSLYGTVKLHQSSTKTGLVLGVGGLIYSASAMITGLFADKKGHELWILAIGLVGSFGTCITFTCLDAINGYLPLLIFGLLYLIIGIFSSFMYIPNISLFTKIARANAIPITDELNSFVSTSVMATVIIGQLIGTAGSGIFYQYLGIANTSIMLAAILFVLFVLLLAVVRPKLKPKTETQSLL